MGFRHTGSAIIFAMGMSVLVSALAIALLLWLTLDIRRVEQLQLSSERLASLEIMEAMAAERIKNLPQDWSDPWRIQNETVKITAQLQDLTGRMNINTLFMQEQDPNSSFAPQAVLTRLFEHMKMAEAEVLLAKIGASQTTLFGIGEIPELATARDYLYAMDPKVQAVNINSTSPEVLASILDITPSQAEAILQQKPFQSPKEILDILAQNELKYDPIAPLEAWLGVEGHYYVLESVFHGSRTVRIYSVLHKESDDITLLWRSWGTMP